MIGGTWALVPTRSFRTGKSRLTERRLGRDRAAIARALFEGTAAVLRRHGGLAGVLVATDGDDVVTAARGHGAEILRDPARPVASHTTLLASIIDRGLAELARRGAAAVVVVMADLPRLAGSDLDVLLSALAGAELVLAPDRAALGTNALAIRLPTPIATAFGNRDSYPRHLATGRRAGVRTAVVTTPGLAFDLDLPADLEELITATGAARDRSRGAAVDRGRSSPPGARR